MFGKKDTIKEFEQMRQALKPAERFATRPDVESPDATDSASRASAPSAHAEPPLHPLADGISLGEVTSVLSTGSVWQGTLKIDGSVRIDGQMTGEIDAKETVYVAESAKMNAKVRAAYVIIAGTFEGEVDCTERLQVMPSGRVKAELTTKSLTVFEGAVIEGQVRMTRGETPATAAIASLLNKNDAGNRKPADKPLPISTVERPATN